METQKKKLPNKKIRLAQRVLKQGLNAASYILLTLAEGSKNFLEELPNSYPGFVLMKKLAGVDLHPYKKQTFKKETVNTNLRRLMKDGLIARNPQQKTYLLTNKGKKFVKYIQEECRILKKPWDGKFRIVIFDIPEKAKYWREIIRAELHLMQFYQLQKSVYIGKYPLPLGFYQELEKASLKKYIFIFTVDKIDREEEVINLLKDSENQKVQNKAIAEN